MLNKPFFRYSLVACICIVSILFSVQWLALFITPEVAILLSIPFWIVFITTIISSFKIIFSIPPNLPHFATIRILAYASPIFGIIAGLFAFEHNNSQVPYLVWYPIFVTLFLIVIVGGLTYLVKRKYSYNSLGNSTNLSSKGSKWLEVVIAIVILLVLVGALYQLLDNSFKEKRLKSYKNCLIQRYGESVYGTNGFDADDMDAEKHPNDRCINLIYKKWGFGLDRYLDRHYEYHKCISEHPYPVGLNGHWEHLTDTERQILTSSDWYQFCRPIYPFEHSGVPDALR